MKVEVDGKMVSLRSGATLLGAATEAGIYIPTLCHDARLKPQGSCGICVVEVQSSRGWRQVPACATPAELDARIRTSSESLKRSRRRTIELLFSHHSRQATFHPERVGTGKPPLVCACRGHKSCSLRGLCLELSAEPDWYRTRAEATVPVLLRPGIELEMEKCVRCDRCVRICREVAGVEALGFAGRGRQSQIVFALSDTDETRTNCDRCLQQGALCIDTCPTDALHPPRSKLKVV